MEVLLDDELVFEDEDEEAVDEEMLGSTRRPKGRGGAVLKRGGPPGKGGGSARGSARDSARALLGGKLKK